MDSEAELQALLEEYAFLSDLLHKLKKLTKKTAYADCCDIANELISLLAKDRRRIRRRADEVEEEIVAVAKALSQAEADDGWKNLK